MLIDWSLESDEDLENVSRFNGDELWDFISNCGERLSKFVNNIIIGYIHIILCFILLCLSLLIDVLQENYLANFLYVTEIVNDLKKKKEEFHGDVDGKLYLLDPKFRLLCEIFTAKTGKKVELEKYIEDCDKNSTYESIFEKKIVNKTEYIRSPHFGYENESGDEKDRKKVVSLIYCGRTFVPKDCLAYLKCGDISGLPCDGCLNKLKNVLEEYTPKKGITDTSRKGNDKNAPDGKEHKMYNLFEICKEEILQRMRLGKAILKNYSTPDDKNETEKKMYSNMLKKASWVPSLKNYLLGGIQCDKCSVRYYSHYMPFLCEQVDVDSIIKGYKAKLFTAKICAKCVLNDMMNKKCSKDGKDGELKIYDKGVKGVPIPKQDNEQDKQEKTDDGKKHKPYAIRDGYKNGKDIKYDIIYSILNSILSQYFFFLFIELIIFICLQILLRGANLHLNLQAKKNLRTYQCCLVRLAI